MADDREWVVAAATRFEGPLLAYVRRLLSDTGRGEDIVQETFLRLCKQARADVEPRLAPWLYTVCRRLAVDVLRKEDRMTALADAAEPMAGHAEPSEMAESKDLGRAVLERLAHLPANQQEAVRLKFVQQFSYREIAQVMELSESHVGVLIHTALKRLRESFSEQLAPAGVQS